MGFRQHKKYEVTKETAASNQCIKTSRKIKILLWKMLVLRKRHWLISVSEVVVPILVYWIVVHFKNMLPEDKKIVVDSEPRRYNDLTVVGNYKIAFSPTNNFTEAIMNGVIKKMSKKHCKVILESRSNEEEVIEWLNKEFINEFNNSTLDVKYYLIRPKGVGVVFMDPEDQQRLKYTLRTTMGNLDTSEKTLYGEQNGKSIWFYDYSGFTTLQTAIDQTYLSLFHNIEVSNSTLMSHLPAIEYTVVDLITLLLPTIVSLGYTFIMPSLLREIVEEKTCGIKEMMKIMGLSPLLNWLHWVVYSVCVYIPVTLAVSVLLTVNFGTGAAIHASFPTVFLLFFLFTITFIVLIFAFSTLFTNGTLAMIAGEVIWYGATVMLNSTVVKVPDKFSLGINLLSCLCPSIALVWSFNTINNFKRNGRQWTIGNLFDDGAGGGRVSVGLAVIMLCLDIILFSIFTWYMDNVKPGPYGRAKPLCFIFRRFRKKELCDLSINCLKVPTRNFEIAPKMVKVGIKVDNLVKTFNQGKVVAVKHVNLDIYEGNITVLLGHNGAGKSTTMSVLSGMFSPSSGSVIVNGKNIFDNMQAFRSYLGLCTQHNLLFSFLTVMEHLVFFGMLKGMSKINSELEGEALLRSLGVGNKRDVLVNNLSGGMKRKLCLAIALVGNPKVLMLDEPTSGMDPESRRLVWDLLLSTRGHRTTIITTHFMEEADVLGDRIAIMDHGQVSCYGTAMFLKKLYGSGYHLNISIKEQAPVTSITKLIDNHLKNATIKLVSPTQISYKIRNDESVSFSTVFAALEKSREELGLTGVGISSPTMEDVFLKVAEKPYNKEDIIVETNSKIPDCKYSHTVGYQLLILQFCALVYKRLLIMIRMWFSTLAYIFIPVLLMAASMVKMMAHDHSELRPPLLITSDSFPSVHVALSSDNHTVIQLIRQLGHAVYDTVPSGIGLNNYMMEKIDENLVQYERQMIASYVFQNNSLLGAYSQYFTHSPSLVLNTIANILLQSVSPSSNITVYNHPLIIKDNVDKCDLAAVAKNHVFHFPLNLIFLSLGLLILTMSFISFPLKERVSQSKQLQLLTGLSPLLYWMSNFICDFTVYLISTVFMLAVLYILQTDGILTSSGYTGTLVLIFVLFGMSGIAFAYFFSFLFKSSIKASVIFVILNMITGTFGGAFLVILDSFYTRYDNWTFFFGFNPLFSATSALIHLLDVMYINGACLQCGVNICKVNDAHQFLKSGPDSKSPHGIYNFLIFLVVDTLIYCGLILAIELGIFKRVKFFFSSIWIKLDYDSYEEDSDVMFEKDQVFASKSINVLGKTACSFTEDKSVLRVYDIGKKFSQKVTAVRGVTFQVGKGQCFGLLGVNGAGKTTTFRMLTGDEIPTKGDACIVQYSLTKQRSLFLAQVGYCPQFDAVNPILTGKEILKIFALLRGIPATECDFEVSQWIDVMGLKEYRDRKCGTYSGGNKRKLSTAMAMIGRPAVVFLDEPTSGVDPVSRRKMWEVVAQCQSAGQAVVLTSHSMEECEVLCSRLTIMVDGRMKCVGSPLHLKHKFSQGYTIKVKLHSLQHLQPAVSSLKLDVESYFKNCHLKDEHVGFLHYHIADSSIDLSEVFFKMEDMKMRHDIIEDYNVSATTLEEVFMAFAKKGSISS